MIEKRWATKLQDITTRPSADCDTDHELLVVTLKLKLKCKKNAAKPFWFDVHDINEDFTIEVKNCFKLLLNDIEEKEPDEMANKIKNIFTETLEKHLSEKCGRKQPWISEETLNKIRERKEAKSASGTHSNYYKKIARGKTNVQEGQKIT